MTNPADLNVVSQPDTDKNYFNFKATNLKINTTYRIKFQWVYSDGQLSDWSPGYFITTSNETAPAVPSATTVPSTATGSIPVTLSSFPTNARRVDVYIIGGIFGLGKVAYSFTTAGTATIAAPAGTYTVQLRSVSPTGVTSTVGTSHEITISDVGETIQSPTNPNGFSSKRILAGVEVSWAGTYANSTFTGFEAINIYAGSSASATSGTYEQVGVLTGNNVKNTIVVPLGTYVVYNQPVYIHAAAVNKSGSVGTIQANVTNQLLGPGKATDADINDGAVVISKLASDVLTVGNLKAGDINATSFIRAGTASSARVELSSANISGGPLAGFHIYNSAGTAVLSAPLNGGLSIVGNGTFTGSISGASGQFDGDLGASGGNFTVRSGTVTALAGSIGGWIINSGVLKSASEAFPRILLDPTNSQIVLRSSNGTSDTGNIIKIDPSIGIRVGTTSSPKFTVGMDGTMSATDAIFSSGTFNGNITSSATISGGTITGGTITGSRIQTATDSIFGSIRMGYATEGFGTGSTLELVGGNGTVYGQLYNFGNNEVILRHGSSREVFGYPTSSAYISLNPFTLTIGYSNSAGSLATGLTLDSGAGGSSTLYASFFNMAVRSNGTDSSGGIGLGGRSFKNTTIHNTAPSGNIYSIGDIWIQY